MGEKLSAWIDAYLQPLVMVSPAYLQDTKHTMGLLDGQPWHDSYRWLSCGMAALYPSIPHDLAVIVVSKYMDTYSSYTPETK